MRLLLALALLLPAPAAAAETDDGAQTQIARAWTACTQTAARHYAKVSTERADVVADAALGVCGKEEQDFRARLLKLLDYHQDEYFRAISDQIARTRRSLIAAVLDARANS